MIKQDVQEHEETMRALPIFFVLDTSGSMAGAPIAMLNQTLEDFPDDDLWE